MIGSKTSHLLLEPNPLRRSIAKLGLALQLVVFPSATLAQAVQPGQNTSSSEAAIPDDGAANKITQMAVQLGSLTCAARVQQLTSFLGVTPETRASLRRPVSPPDSNSLSIAMTVETDGTTGIALAEFYPVQGRCKASYSLTVNLQQSCSEVRTKNFSELVNEDRLSENILLLVGQNTLRVLLSEVGTGCTVIKTEILD